MSQKFKRAKPFTFEAMNHAQNPRGIHLTAEPVGDDSLYQEIAVSATLPSNAGKPRIADVNIGLTGDGELRILITTGNDGDGDHDIAIYPQRPHDQAVDTNYL